MKQRWPLTLLLSCWLLILLVPPLRQLFFAQLWGDGFYRGWAYGPVPQLDDGFSAQKLDVEKVRDIRVLAVKFMGHYRGMRSVGEYDLDALIENHPQEAWLLARRLLQSMGQMQIDRTGGELSDGNLAQNQAAKI